MNIEILEKIGLTPGESRTYLALLNIGLSTVTPIAKQANVSISKIYEVLDGLIKKGLVTTITKNNVKYFNATNPNRILDYLEEKQNKIEIEKKEIRKEIPYLQSRQKKTNEKVTTEVYEGVKGVKTCFDNIVREMNHKETIYTLGLPKIATTRFGGYFYHDWTQKRIEKKICSKILFNYDAKDIGKSRKSLKDIEIKYLPETITTPVATYIYNNTVVILCFGENPICVVTKNEDIAKTYLSYFNFLWEISTK